MSDPVTQMKAAAKETWAMGDFDHVYEVTGLSSMGENLVAHADIGPGTRVLDVGAGSGNASLPAARAGGKVVASDLTPELLEKAVSYTHLTLPTTPYV